MARSASRSTRSASRRSRRNSIRSHFTRTKKRRGSRYSAAWRQAGGVTAALTMRLLVESEFRPAGGIIGAGFDELRWPLPVRPGDQLHIDTEVLDVRPAKSRPHLGLVKVRITTTNQNGEAVQVFVANIVVPRRPAA